MNGCDVLLINPPFLTLTSMIGVGHQVPLGLLMVGGALLDAGVRVQLLDAECTRMSVAEVVADDPRDLDLVLDHQHRRHRPILTSR